MSKGCGRGTGKGGTGGKKKTLKIAEPTAGLLRKSPNRPLKMTHALRHHLLGQELNSGGGGFGGFSWKHAQSCSGIRSGAQGKVQWMTRRLKKPRFMRTCNP